MVDHLFFEEFIMGVIERRNRTSASLSKNKNNFFIIFLNLKNKPFEKLFNTKIIKTLASTEGKITNKYLLTSFPMLKLSFEKIWVLQS